MSKSWQKSSISVSIICVTSVKNPVWTFIVRSSSSARMNSCGSAGDRRRRSRSLTRTFSLMTSACQPLTDRSEPACVSNFSLLHILDVHLQRTDILHLQTVSNPTRRRDVHLKHTLLSSHCTSLLQIPLSSPPPLSRLQLFRSFWCVCSLDFSRRTFHTSITLILFFLSATMFAFVCGACLEYITYIFS